MRKQLSENSKEGDEVLVLLPTKDHPLKAKFQGSYKIRRKINELKYVVGTADREMKKTEMSH